MFGNTLDDEDPDAIFLLNLKNYFSRKDVSKLLEFMKNDKKNNSNKINLILIKKIGNVAYNNFFDLNKISKFIRLQFYNM